MASEQVCQALTGCVNALGQHNRRCPAAPSEPPAADSPTPGTCGEWVVTRRCARPVGHEGWHRNGDQASGVASYVAPSPVGTTEPPAETQQGEACACGCDETDHGVVTGCIHCSRCWEYGPRSQYVPAARPSADTETLRARVEEVREQLSQRVRRYRHRHAAHSNAGRADLAHVTQMVADAYADALHLLAAVDGDR